MRAHSRDVLVLLDGSHFIMPVRFSSDGGRHRFRPP